jgi:hypothetical protein
MGSLEPMPPTALFNRFIAKAIADGVRAIVVMPLAVSAPYWTKLLRASVFPNEDGYVRVSRQPYAPPDSDTAGELAIFAVDFTLWSSRRRTSSPAPPCGLEALFRGRDPLGFLVDQDERRRIRARLVQLGLALR